MGQLGVMRDLEFETCPGEDECGVSGPIAIARAREPDMPIADICEGDPPCRFLPTKPGQEPRHLTLAIITATELDSDKSICGAFNYPRILNVLTAFEWACLAALTAARAESEVQKLRERRNEAEAVDRRADLEQARRRK